MIFYHLHVYFIADRLDLRFRFLKRFEDLGLPKDHHSDHAVFASKNRSVNGSATISMLDVFTVASIAVSSSSRDL